MKTEHTQAILDVLRKAQDRLTLTAPGTASAQAIALAIQQAHEGIGRAMLMLKLVNRPDQTGAQTEKS